MFYFVAPPKPPKGRRKRPLWPPVWACVCSQKYVRGIIFASRGSLFRRCFLYDWRKCRNRDFGTPYNENFQEPSLQPLFCGLPPHRRAHRYRKAPLLLTFGLRPCPLRTSKMTLDAQNTCPEGVAQFSLFMDPLPKLPLSTFWLHSGSFRAPSGCD